MKKISLTNLFYPVLLIAIVISGCTKDDGPIKEEYLNLIDAVPAISTAIDPTGSPAIDVLNPGNFQGKFNVTNFFTGPGSETPEKVDIVVRKTGSSGTTVKLFQENVTTLPATYSVNTAALETLFGAPIELGDNYDFSADIYIRGGKKFEAFPLGGIPASSGVTAPPGFSLMARFSVICAYNPDIYQGEFEVIADASYSGLTGKTVTLSKVTDNSFSFQYPSTSIVNSVNRDIVVIVNTDNNTVSIPRTASLGGAWAWSSSYSGPSVATSGAVTASLVKPCDQTVTLNLNYTVDAGSFGTFAMTMKKK